MRLSFLVLVSAFAFEPGLAQEQLLLYNANLVDVASGDISLGSVLIQGSVIAKTGAYDQLKRGVPVGNQLDCKGKYIIPGLWDMHIHLEGAELIEDNLALLPVFLAYGITSVRDCASDLGKQVLSWRNEIASGKLVGPTIYTAGLKLEGKNSIWKGDLEIENEVELDAMLNKLDSLKVDFVKITENTLSGDLFLKSVKAAHSRGYRVSGHVPIEVPIEELVHAEFTSIEHAGYMLRLGCNEKQITNDLRSGKITKAEANAQYTATFDQALAMKNYATLAKTGVYVCPTYIGGRQLAWLHEVDHSKDIPLSYLTEKYVSNYQWRIQRMGNETPEQRQKRKDNYMLGLKQLPLFQQAGLRIIAGSDCAALNTMVYPAESLLEELEIFAEAGLTPKQVLQIATVNAASYFGLEAKTASINEGRVADLVVLDENPLTSVKSLRKINSVVSRGKLYNRHDLDAIMEQARQRKQRLDSERRK